MRERLSERVRQFRSKSRPILSNGSVVLALLIVTVAGIGAAQTFTFQDDFDQYADGTTAPGDWTGGTVNGSYLEVSSGETASYTGQQFNTTNATIQAEIRYTDLSSNTEIQLSDHTVYYDPALDGVIEVANGQTENQTTGTCSPSIPGNVTLYAEMNETTVWGSVVCGDSDERYNVTVPTTVSTDANITITQESGTEPSAVDYVFAGAFGSSIEEPTEDDAELELDTRDYIKPNESAPYSVHFNDSGDFSEVTDSPNTTVTSNNTSVIVVNAAENLLEGQPGVNTTVNVTAEYMASDGTVYSTTKQITVAQATVDNLEILPAIWRFGATLGDDTIFFLIIAMLTGIVGTRLSTAFGGISLYWVVVMIGWFSGWLSLGILLVTTAMSVFIGLNLALTIDYGMRPGQG